MNAGDVVASWILALPTVAIFFFVYGIIEEAIQKRRATRKGREPHEACSPLPPLQPVKKADIPPDSRGYDTPELFREDALMHIRRNETATIILVVSCRAAKYYGIVSTDRSHYKTVLQFLNTNKKRTLREIKQAEISFRETVP